MLDSLKRKQQRQMHRTVLPVRKTKKQRRDEDADSTAAGDVSASITGRRSGVPPVSVPVIPVPSLGQTSFLRFVGSRNFRDRLICSTLSGKPIRIDNIRDKDATPGIKDFEVSFLRLLESISNGCKVTINESGTSIKYTPGLLTGGHILGLTHNCPTSRSIGYYLEALLCIAPFVSREIRLTLTGITNDHYHRSVDLLRTVTLPLTKHFGFGNDTVTMPSTSLNATATMPALKINKRGAPRLGGGEVLFTCPILKHLTPINLSHPGLIKRVRGLAYATRCSAQMANRMIDSARAVLHHLLPDVYIYSDVYKGKNSGLSPGYGLALVAESTTGVLISAEYTSDTTQTALDSSTPGDTITATRDASSSITDSTATATTAVVSPELVGRRAAELLLSEISRGGCVDSTHQSMVLLWMLLTPESISRVRLGPLTTHTIECLRLYQQFFGVTFQLTEDSETNTVLCSVMGTGFRNLSRKAV